MKNSSFLLRIFFTYLLTGGLIIATLMGSMRAFAPERKIPLVLEQNIIKYLLYLESDPELNLNPDLIREKLGLQIQIGNGILSKHVRDTTLNGLSYGMNRDYYFAFLESSPHNVVWLVERGVFPKVFIFPIITAISFIVLILLMSFLSIRWIMHPINLVLNGAQELANGNFKFRINKLKKSGSLVKVIQNFNSIADQLEKHVTAKENLLRDVSHDLRSPLTRMKVALSMIESGHLKKSLLDDVDTMEHMIENILTAYQMRSGSLNLNFKFFDLSRSLKNLIHEFNSTETTNRAQVKSISIIDEVTPSIQMFGDEERILRVFKNLIENALCYSKPESQKVIVRLFKNTEESITVEVEDFGIGISPENITKIFKPFFRVEKARTPNKNGFGLGLSICHSIIAAHQGQITVTSQIGVGSIFKVIIPFSNHGTDIA